MSRSRFPKSPADQVAMTFTAMVPQALFTVAAPYPPRQYCKLLAGACPT
jgi:hypothetical protein